MYIYEKVKSGGHLPSLEVLSYICDYFKISLSEFFDIGKKSRFIEYVN